MKRFFALFLSIFLSLSCMAVFAHAETVSAPTVTTAKLDGNGILVEWDAVEGATGYVVYRRAMTKDSTTWTTFARWNNTTQLNFLDTKVYAGTKYQYGVKAYYGSDPTTKTNLGPVGPMTTALVFATKPGTTTSTKAVNGIHCIDVSWAKVPGATGYIIYRRAWSESTGGWTAFSRWNNTTELSFSDSKVYPGTKYQYGIKAYSGNDSKNMAFVGDVGPIATMVCVTIRTPTYVPDYHFTNIADSTALYSDFDRIEDHKLSWDASKQCTGYVIQYSTDPSFAAKQSITISNKSTCEKRIPVDQCMTTYYARVRSYTVSGNNTYYGMWSKTISFSVGHIVTQCRITKPATCTSSGIMSESCPKCGHLGDFGLEPYGHNFEGGVCTSCGEFESGTVWIVSGGKSYHSSPLCSGMKNPVSVSREAAINSGRTACPKCW